MQDCRNSGADKEEELADQKTGSKKRDSKPEGPLLSVHTSGYRRCPICPALLHHAYSKTYLLRICQHQAVFAPLRP